MTPKEPFRFRDMHYIMFLLGIVFMVVVIMLVTNTPRKGQPKMAKEDAIVGPQMMAEVGRLFKNAVEKAATTRTRKYKASNDSLRKDQAALKQKIAGLEAEFKPMASWAAAAEKTVEQQSDRIRELKVTVQALQKELTAKMKE